MKTQFLMLLAVLMMTATGAKAEDVLYAVKSGTSITFSFGEAPAGAVIYDGTETWATTIYPTTTTATFDASCASYNGTTLAFLFAAFRYLEIINGIENLNTSTVTDMQNMFYDCDKLVTLDLSSFDTSSVQSMHRMFRSCDQLANLFVGSWDTSSVTDMLEVFMYCSSLTHLDLSGWNTANVTTMYSIFSDCTSLTSIIVSDAWSTAGITSWDNGNYMFYNCPAIVGEDGTTYNSSNYNKTYAHFGTGGYLRNNYLYDAEDNSARLMGWNGYTFGSIKIKGRTLKAGKWNSLCLPFSLSADQIAASFPAGTEMKTLDSYSNDGSTVTVTFADAATIQRGRPYIVFIPEGSDIADPVFNNVIISPASVITYQVTQGDASFIGTYSPVALSASTKHLFLQNNTLYYPNGTTDINAFRAYFALETDVPTGGSARIVIDFGDEEATAINAVQQAESGDGSWYTLTGVKLDGEPNEKGIYIFNGKKVSVK